MSFRLTHPKIIAKTGTDLSSASDPEIHYKKPGGEVGEWAAEISGENIEYQTTGDDLDQKGVWEFQAVAYFGPFLKKGKIRRVEIPEPIKTT